MPRKRNPATWITDKYVQERFRDFRRDAGQTQAEFAKMLGIKDLQSVYQIEAGLRRLTSVELIRLLIETGRSLEDFLD